MVGVANVLLTPLAGPLDIELSLMSFCMPVLGDAVLMPLSELIVPGVP